MTTENSYFLILTLAVFAGFAFTLAYISLTTSR